MISQSNCSPHQGLPMGFGTIVHGASMLSPETSLLYLLTILPTLLQKSPVRVKSRDSEIYFFVSFHFDSPLTIAKSNHRLDFPNIIFES